MGRVMFCPQRDHATAIRKPGVLRHIQQEAPLIGGFSLPFSVQPRPVNDHPTDLARTPLGYAHSAHLWKDGLISMCNRLFLGILLAASYLLAVDNWPQFRGPG